jgi:hypothetical protein
MKKKRGVGLAHRKRVAALRPNSGEGRGPGARASSKRGRGVKGGGVCLGGRSWERKGKGGGDDGRAL